MRLKVRIIRKFPIIIDTKAGAISLTPTHNNPRIRDQADKEKYLQAFKSLFASHKSVSATAEENIPNTQIMRTVIPESIFKHLTVY